MDALKINKLEFDNDNKEYIYIGNYNILFEKSQLLEDILDLIVTLKEDEIIYKLKDKYSELYTEEELAEQIKVIKTWFDNIDNKVQDEEKKIENISEKDWENKKLLSTLSMNISHDCNLRCIYCYGDGGSYGKKVQLMSAEKAKEIIDYWFKHLNIHDDNIQIIFFGGEPLMNKDVLIFSVNYINKLLSEYNRVPNYSITTNGTILDDEILNIFKNNNFSITLSIDGGEEIQNENRPFVSGRGSFNKLKENIQKLGELSDALIARLTLTHKNVSYFAESVKDIWELGIPYVTFDIVSSMDDGMKITNEDLDILKPQIKELKRLTYENIVNGNNGFFGPLIQNARFLHKKTIGPICAFHSKKALMVDPDGIFFKCQRLSSGSEFDVGDLNSGLNWNKFVQYKKIQCNDCWANNICIKCAPVNYMYNKDISKPYGTWCEYKKMLIKEGINLYVDLLNNHPEIHKRFY